MRDLALKGVAGAVLVGALALSSVGVQADGSPNGTYHSHELNANLPIVNVTVNTVPVESSVPGVILDGSTMLPVRPLVQALGGKVAWDPATYTATISTPAGTVSPSAQVSEWVAAWHLAVGNAFVTMFPLLVNGAPSAGSAGNQTLLNNGVEGLQGTIAELGASAGAPGGYGLLDADTVQVLADMVTYGRATLGEMNDIAGNQAASQIAADTSFRVSLLGSIQADVNTLQQEATKMGLTLPSGAAATQT